MLKRWTRIFQHLLPHGLAWRLPRGGDFRALVDAFGTLPETIRGDGDGLWSDLFPSTTTELDAWENQFGLRADSLSETARRERLRGRWSATGGQSPRYIQDVLRNSGFDLTVHEWWLPEADSRRVLGLSGTNEVLMLEDGTVLEAQQFGDQPRPHRPAGVIGNLIANRCGQPSARCQGAENSDPVTSGTDSVVALEDGTILTVRFYGNSYGFPVTCSGFIESGYMLVNRDADAPEYPDPPEDSDHWPYVLYIGAPTFGDVAVVPLERRDELEALLLTICPAQQWLGMMVSYQD